MTGNFIISHWIKNYENLKDQDVREQYGTVSGILGVIINLILFIMEIIVGIVTNSIAIIADAFHNLADVTSALVTLVGFKLSNKPADEQHPFGHGRMEYIAALVISFLILLVGVEFIKTSFDRIVQPQEVNFSGWTLAVILLAIPLKLWLSYFNKFLGKRIGSGTLKAAGADALNDVAILSGVILSFVVSDLFDINIDGYVGMIVAIFIFLSGLSLIKKTISPLLGQAPDPQLVKNIRAALVTYDYILGTHDLIIHNYGPGRALASIHAEVPYNVSVMKIHEVIDKAEKELSKKFNMFIVIHMDPVNFDSAEVAAAKKIMERILADFPSIHSFHDFRVVGEGENKNLIFDIVIGFDKKVTPADEKQLVTDINTVLKREHPGYHAVITIDKDYSGTH